jgi:hypothetical protein
MPTLSSLSVSDLQREINRRSRVVRTLIKRRNKAAAKLDALDQEIAMNGGTGGGRSASGRTRLQNELTLVDALANTLKGTKMGLAEAAAAVQKSGYRTNAANFRTMVNIALLKNKKRFKKVERGVYTAK